MGNNGDYMMWSEEKILEYIKNNLKESRYMHSLGVSETAVSLAKIYGADVDKARISGLIHDCAKEMGKDEMLKLIEDSGIVLDEITLKSPQLLHCHAGAIIAENMMEIKDLEILSSIRFHTTGKKNMSLIEKIIYLADYIEPNRSFKGIEAIRETAQVDLDRSVLMAFESTISFVMKNGELIHLDTIEGRNYLIL